MQQYQITLNGLTPLLMHNDNLAFTEKVNAWRKDPANKELSVSGDDRTPPWTWIGYLYHDGKNLGVAADNLMTMLREGGAKVLTGKGKETYKEGSIPVNVDGGLLSKGHPIGATGGSQIRTIVLQLRGEAGEMQIRDYWPDT